MVNEWYSGRVNWYIARKWGFFEIIMFQGHAAVAPTLVNGKHKKWKIGIFLNIAVLYRKTVWKCSEQWAITGKMCLQSSTRTSASDNCH